MLGIAYIRIRMNNTLILRVSQSNEILVDYPFPLSYQNNCDNQQINIYPKKTLNNNEQIELIKSYVIYLFLTCNLSCIFYHFRFAYHILSLAIIMFVHVSVHKQLCKYEHIGVLGEEFDK